MTCFVVSYFSSESYALKENCNMISPHGRNNKLGLDMIIRRRGPLKSMELARSLDFSGPPLSMTNSGSNPFGLCGMSFVEVAF